MPSFRFRRSPFAEERVLEDLEHERRRREWAEQLAEAGFHAGEHNMTRADHVERLLGDMLALTEAHQEAALKADAVRTGDLRLYRHARRIRGELNEIKAPPELLADHRRPIPGPGEESHSAAENQLTWLAQGAGPVGDAKANGGGDAGGKARNGHPGAEVEFPALL